MWDNSELVFQIGEESSPKVLANVLVSDIVVSEFELNLRYYVHFRT